MPCGICGQAGHNRRTCGAGSFSSSSSSSSYFDTPRQSYSTSGYGSCYSYEAPRYTSSYTTSSGRDLDDLFTSFGSMNIKQSGGSKKATSSQRMQWNSEAHETYENGPSEKDHPGKVYVYRDPNDSKDIKIGSAKDVEKRVRAQERANDANYDILGEVNTPCKLLAERMVQKQLASKHQPKAYGDGKDEWYAADPDEALKIAKKAAEKIKRNPDYVDHCLCNQ